MQDVAVVSIETKDGINEAKLIYLNEDNIPETLNGESGFHNYHVRLLTEFILRELQEVYPEYELTDQDVENIAIASSLHDIGKSRLPSSILNYTGRLSPVQYDIVKSHSAFGEEIINKIPRDEVPDAILKHAAEIARSHHERYDGTGYPDGLKGDAIPLSAQVVALADSFDALTSARSYKQAYSQDVAVQMISSGMCGVFNEKILSCFLKVVNHRSLVELREVIDKRRAVVAETAGVTPERVLCIGNTEYLTKEFIEATFPESRVMVIGNTELGSADKIKLFRIKKPSIKAIFDTYEFDVVAFFSVELTYDTTEKSDAEELREVLQYARQTQKGTKVLYFSSLESSFDKKTDKSIICAAKENLCEFYDTNPEVDIKIIQIPYLYSGTRKKDFLNATFEQAYKGRTVELSVAAHEKMHFMSLTDLSELIIRVLDNWKTGGGVLSVGDDFDYNFADFAKKLTEVCGAKVDFTDDKDVNALKINNKALRNEYGWFAKISILDDLEDEYQRFIESKKEKAETWWDKVKNWVAHHSLLIKITELILFFLITEGLLHLTDSSVVFTLIDFRLVYIVVMATVHGLSYGLASAALSSVSWFVAKVLSGTNALTIFYEPTNWLTIILFFLVGAICGYVKLRKDDQIRATCEENKLLEDKLVFTREIYEDTFREKRDLKRQIIGSKDSFGKIFDITRRLDTVEPQELYLSIMDTFEEVLDNKNITVYSVGENSAFGRLEVASRDIIDSVARSISTDTYAEIIKGLEGGEVWKNTDLKPDFPMYAAGVYNDKKLIMLIFLWHADIGQRSLYYVNLFKILRDLVQMSLIRAFDYNKAIYDKQFISGTNIMNIEAFHERYVDFVALAERKVATFILMEIDYKGCALEEVSNILSSKIRASDILGMSEEGKLKLILSQATKDDLKYILPRFEGLGFEITVLN